jgi:hypothetical protein
VPHRKNRSVSLFSTRRTGFYGLGAVVLSGLMIVFTTLPGDTPLVTNTSKLLGGTDLTDAIGHTVLMGLLTTAWYGCALHFMRSKYAVGTAALIALTLGTSSELFQTLIPERGATFLDLAANWLGVLCFLLWLQLSSGITLRVQHLIHKRSEYIHN